MELEQLLQADGKQCACGKMHYALLKGAKIGNGVLDELTQTVAQFGKTVYLVCDQNTFSACGKQVEVLLQSDFVVRKFCFPTKEPIEPDEIAVGSAVMHAPTSFDVVVGVGSGVINDVCKIVAALAGKPYVIVGTAPSMDGYASATSSMARDGLKVSLPSKCPDFVFGDARVLAQSPMRMIVSGVGDMLAKYISVCEWRIAALLMGEYYCEEIAQMVRTALKTVVDLAPALPSRAEDAVCAVMDGMVLSGIAANYAGISRPVSGLEHYFSHVWDMCGLAKHTPVDLHGIQCGAATVEALRVYNWIRGQKIDKQKALAFAASFDEAKYNDEMRSFIGSGSEAMIELEKKERKYDVAKHAARLDKIISLWDEILKIMDEELPPVEVVTSLLTQIGAPACAAELGKTNEEIAKTLVFSKDIRDKYVGSRLLWDLGLTAECTLALYGVAYDGQ